MTKRLLSAAVVLGLLCAAPARAAGDGRVDVRLVTDEAEAVLAVLEKRRAKAPVGEADWARLFSSEGYVRLKRRELAMKVPFGDEAFKAFALSDELAARAPALEETLRRYARADVASAARRALAYLPAEARVRAKVYLTIKPRTNSFVFDLSTDPAIFVYLDPEVTREQLENTLAHEMHHIGYGTACPSKTVAEDLAKLPEGERKTLRWMGAFGEGFAMLAAAGGPDAHPHAASTAEDRERWDRDVANVDGDLRAVERFFGDLRAGRLTAEQELETARSFYGVQGPWYTVGWRMAVTIEKAFGRERLVEAFCDPRRLLSIYNEAARAHNRGARAKLPLWDESLAGALTRT